MDCQWRIHLIQIYQLDIRQSTNLQSLIILLKCYLLKCHIFLQKAYRSLQNKITA